MALGLVAEEAASRGLLKFPAERNALALLNTVCHSIGCRKRLSGCLSVCLQSSNGTVSVLTLAHEPAAGELTRITNSGASLGMVLVDAGYAVHKHLVMDLQCLLIKPTRTLCFQRPNAPTASHFAGKMPG